MINLNIISILLLTLLILIFLTLSFLDYRQKRVLRGRPKVSFLVPCYNDGDSVEDTIRSIYATYDKRRFELLVVNDRSTDDSLAVLRRLQKRYRFTLVSNTENVGKSASLNALSQRAKHDILFFVDADIILNRQAVEDVLARLQEKKVAAVGSQFLSENKGFLPVMQTAEYYMLTLIQGAHNRFSTMSLCGACFAVKKEAFEAVGRFSENAILEDLDLALKLREASHKVQQSFYHIKSYVPDTAKIWYRQKIRWSSGSTQNIIKHFRTWIRSPLTLIFLFLFSLLGIIAALSLIRQALLFENLIGTVELLSKTTVSLVTLKTTGIYYGAILLKNLLTSIYFSAFSLPYIIPMVRGWKELHKILLAIPFGLLYLPAYSIVSTIGMVIGIVQYRRLARGERAW